MLTLYFAVGAAAAYLFYAVLLEPLYFSPLSKIPGPTLYAVTKWRSALDDWRGVRTVSIDRLHLRYGPAVRIGPSEVHFNSLAALQKIYGAGSGFERTTFYRMFDVYGRQNLFTFHSSKQHGDRKKLLANAYSKSTMLKPVVAAMVERKTVQYLRLVEEYGRQPNDLFKTLHYFSIDSITTFLYGSSHGGTSALTGSGTDRDLLTDIFDPARRKLSWFATHAPRLTKWLYTRTHLAERLVQPLLPMQKPSTYTGIRAHALQAFHRSRNADKISDGEPTVIGELFKHADLQDLDIASECADHLLAGIDTTADTLMFLFWALSLPKHRHVQQRLIAEVREMQLMSDGNTKHLVEASDKLPYLDAVIKETLRLYAPLSASEPRRLPAHDTEIAGYLIPAGTVVGMAPYSLHRDPEVFDSPLEFRPERWLVRDISRMNRWFWAFSSGGRMCIGKHLAMAEMTSLTAAVYREYTTVIAPGFEGKSPAITSRVEMFYDMTQPAFAEHECPIVFEKH